jgi:hypothetical protein
MLKAVTFFIHELFQLYDKILKYKYKKDSPEKQGVLCTGWKACATEFFVVRRIIRVSDF